MKTILRRMHFFQNALRDRKIGAITMSSSYVVSQVLRHLPTNPRVVIEYGPGEGAITRAILGAIPRDGRLVAVEPNKDFFVALQAIDDPRLTVIQKKAQDLSAKELKQFRGADVIVASLPFSLLTTAERTRVVSDAHDILTAGGQFIVSHQYSWLMREPLLRKFFAVQTFFEPRNLFPCFIFNAQKEPIG